MRRLDAISFTLGPSALFRVVGSDRLVRPSRSPRAMWESGHVRMPRLRRRRRFDVPRLVAHACGAVVLLVAALALMSGQTRAAAPDSRSLASSDPLLD